MDETYGNGKEVPPLTVRAEIDNRLKELEPEQFIASPVKRTSDMHFICMATEEIKRLHTLREQLATKHEALTQKNLETNRDAKEHILSMERGAANEELKTAGSFLFVANETTTNLERELWRTDSLWSLVDINLWFEVRRQHADLETKPVCICNDWSLCWVDENATKPVVITQVTMHGNDSAVSVRNPKRTVH